MRVVFFQLLLFNQDTDLPNNVMPDISVNNQKLAWRLGKQNIGN
jgi:hypothetical protein